MFSADLFSPRADAIMGVLWALAIIVTVMIAMRVYVFRQGDGEGAWALFWACAAYIIGVVSQALLTISFKAGMGGHIADVEAHGDILDSIKWGWVGSSINLFGIAFGKWTVIAFLLALHGRTYLKSKIALLVLAGINMALDAALCFVIMFQCNPPAAAWDFSPEMQARARCSSAYIQRNLGFTTAAVNSGTDFILAAYPVYLFHNSPTMALRRKVTVCLLLSAGVVAGACGIAKAYQIQTVETSHDQTWDTALLWVWTWAELWVILMAACVPPLAQVFASMFCCASSRKRRASLRADPQQNRESWAGIREQLEADAVSRGDLNQDPASPASEQPQSSIELDVLGEDVRPASASGGADCVGRADTPADGVPPKDAIRMQMDVSVEYGPSSRKGDYGESRGRSSAW